MEGLGSGSGSGSSGPAPFLLKTYEMVDDSSTDEIVSWSSSMNSFIVWNPADFSRLLLPTYFKHNNFSSFIRQLNTYGFRKVHAERWEFANEDFVKDKKQRLKNIHRRKPIHSHSHSHSHSQNPGSAVDPERSAYEEEIDNLSHDKVNIQSNIFRFKQQHSVAKVHLEDLRLRLDDMEKRQKNLLSFFEEALQNPCFVEHMSRRIESMDLLAYSKKRRLPQVDDQLQPAVSDMVLGSCSTHSSNEDGGESSHMMMLYEGEPKEVHTKTALGFAPEAETTIQELQETVASFSFNMDSCLSQTTRAVQCPKLDSLEQNCEETDSYISCLLNLTLASSPLQVKRNIACPDRSSQIDCPEIGKLTEPNFYVSDNKESSDVGASSSRNLTNEVTNSASSHKAPSDNQVTEAAPVRVNDVFWEQLLTERP